MALSRVGCTPPSSRAKSCGSIQLPIVFSCSGGCASHCVLMPRLAVVGDCSFCSFRDFCAACSRTGLLRGRGIPLQRAAARICSEAGATVAANVLLRDLNIITRRHGDRHIKVIANGLPLWKKSSSLPRAPARSAVPPRRDCLRGCRTVECKSHSVRPTPRPLPSTVRASPPACQQHRGMGGPDSLLLRPPGPLQPRCCRCPCTALPTSMADCQTSAMCSLSTGWTAHGSPVGCPHADVHSCHCSSTPETTVDVQVAQGPRWIYFSTLLQKVYLKSNDESKPRKPSRLHKDVFQTTTVNQSKNQRFASANCKFGLKKHSCHRAGRLVWRYLVFDSFFWLASLRCKVL